ncbi:MAG: WD40 repeat domain-containing protein [Bryobacteraceae bacterium]
MLRLFCTLAATVLLAAPAPAQTLLEGGHLEPPVLGRFFDPQTKSVRTISGVPGASSASPASDGAFRYGVSAPHRPWSIVDRAAAGSLELLTFSRSTPILRGFDAANGVDQIAFSPSGDAAVLYWRGSRAEVWRNFSTAPERAGLYSLESMDGDVVSLAVADDGSAAALIVRQDGASRLYVLADGVRETGDDGNWSAVAFAPGNRTAYAANRETNEVLRFTDFGSSGAAAVVASDADGIASPSALAISGDGRTLIVANQDDPSIAILNLDSRRSSVLTLERAADGLFALAGNAVFRLSSAAKPELFVLDADSADARITVIAAPTAADSATADPSTSQPAVKGGK